MRLFTWIKNEVIHVLPAVIYFCVVLNLIFYVTGLSLPPGTVRYFSYFSITLFSLVLGKVMIIANTLPFIHLFPNKPLIYSILWKVFVYDMLVVLVWMGDTFLNLYFHYQTAALAFDVLKIELLSPLFLSSLIWLLLFFIIFVFFSEIIRVIGREKMHTIMFG